MGICASRLVLPVRPSMLDSCLGEFMEAHTIEKSGAVVIAPVFVAAFSAYVGERLRVREGEELAMIIDDFLKGPALRRLSEWGMTAMGCLRQDRAVEDTPALLLIGRELNIDGLRRWIVDDSLNSSVEMVDATFGKDDPQG